jgi:hypothetical protein
MIFLKLLFLFLSNQLVNSQTCKPLYDNSCTSNGQCCSGYCDNNNGQWALGVCKPGSTTVTTGSLISLSEFEQAVVANGYPKPNSIKYNNLVNQAGSKGNIYTKLELAMFLAQILWESDGLRAMREYLCYPTLSSTSCAYSSGIGFPGQNYFGRGYIQLVSRMFCIYSQLL